MPVDQIIHLDLQSLVQLDLNVYFRVLVVFKVFEDEGDEHPEDQEVGNIIIAEKEEYADKTTLCPAQLCVFKVLISKQEL